MPGAGWIDIMASAGLAAAQAERGAKTSSAEELVHLEEVSFERPLLLAKADDKQSIDSGNRIESRCTPIQQAIPIAARVARNAVTIQLAFTCRKS